MSAAVAGLILSLFCLVLFTQIFISCIEQLARFTRLSTLTLGILLVSVVTSLPELTVSYFASLRGDFNLALGNIIGSNIANLLLVLPFGLLFNRIRVGTIKTPKTALFLLASTALFSIFCFRLPPLVPFKSPLLLLLFLAFIPLQLFWASTSPKTTLKPLSPSSGRLLRLVAKLGISLIGITISAYLNVIYTESFSRLAGLSTAFLGLTLTAVSTSLPELISTFVSQEKRDEKLTLGNILGSNIFNLTLIGGVIFAFTPASSLPAYFVIILFLVTLANTCFIFIYRGKHLPPLLALIYVPLYLMYLYLTYLSV